MNEATFRAYMAVAAIGTVFAAGYLLWMLQRAAFGTPKEEFAHEPISDMHTAEYVAWVPLLVLILALGIYPAIIFGVTDDAVQVAVKAFGG